MSLLDDLKMIHMRDAQDALGVVGAQANQLTYNFEVTPAIATGPYSSVVYAGMGGSALAALFAPSLFKPKKPFEVVRDYTLPAYVDNNTLIIVSSYSGNTEEALNSLADAENKGASIVIIAGGGRLAEIAKEKNYPLALLPEASQPRYAVLYSLNALATILDQANITSGAQAELASGAAFLQQAVESWKPDVPASQNPAKQLAQELVGSSVVVYASSLFSPVAYKWKISFNENAKQVAWTGTYPEFNHNEFIGWSNQPVDKPYKVVDLVSNLDHPRIQKRFELSDRMLSGKRPAAHTVQLQGGNLNEQMLWGIAFGDFISVYVALLNGINPAPVELVEKFKHALQ